MQDWVQQSRDYSANHSGWHKLAPSPAPPHMPDMAVPSVRPVSHSMFASGQRPDPLTKRIELDETEKAKRWHANDCKCRVSEKHGKRAQQISKQRMCKKGKWRVQIWSMHHAQPQETHSVVIITYCHSRKHTHTFRFTPKSKYTLAYSHMKQHLRQAHTYAQIERLTHDQTVHYIVNMIYQT